MTGKCGVCTAMLLLMAAFSAGTVVLGEKVYRRSLMQTRGRLSWKQAMRTAD